MDGDPLIPGRQGYGKSKIPVRKRQRNNLTLFGVHQSGPLLNIAAVLLTLLILAPVQVGAQEISLKLLKSFTVNDPRIGERSPFRIQGTMNDGGSIDEGDCFRIVWVEPYGQAKQAFQQCATNSADDVAGFTCESDDFFQPFPPESEGAYSVVETSVVGDVTVSRVSGDELLLTLGAGAANPDGDDFVFEVANMMTPYSANGASRFSIKHYDQCVLTDPAAYTPCAQIDVLSEGDCDSEVIDFAAPGSADVAEQYTEPAVITLEPLDPCPDAEPCNYLGDVNAVMKFSFLPTRYFPKYGGVLDIIVPKRYGPGTEGIFRKSNDRTTCTSPDLLNMMSPFYEEKDEAGEVTITYSVQFSAYKGDHIAPIVLTCRDISNPVYYGEELRFQFTVRDGQKPFLIFSYPEFTYTPAEFDPLGLQSLVREDWLQFTWLDEDDNDYSTSSQYGGKVPIQSYLTLQITFTMPIPVAYAADDSQGCYIKYQFPDDLPLYDDSGNPLQFQGFDLLEQQNTVTRELDPPTMTPRSRSIPELEYMKEDKNSPQNYFVARGCGTDNFAGTGYYDDDLQPKVVIKIKNFYSPNAMKTTKPVVVDVYTDYDRNADQGEGFTNHILTTQQSMDGGQFIGGGVSLVEFAALSEYVQVCTRHTFKFTADHALPGNWVDNPAYRSRVIVMMPPQMQQCEASEAIELSAVLPDNFWYGGTVTQMTSDPADPEFYTAPDGMTNCEGRLCYALEQYSMIPRNADIIAGTLLSFDISSSSNQDSVRDAGDFAIATQWVYEGADATTPAEKFFPVDFGTFPSNFEPTIGGISQPANRRVEIFAKDGSTYTEKYETYNDKAIYRVYFTLNQRLPAGGRLKVTLPSEVELQSEDPESPYVGFLARDSSGAEYSGIVKGDTDSADLAADPREVLFNIVSEVRPGDYDIRFGYVRNPRTTGATDLAVQVHASDGDPGAAGNFGYEIADGDIDVLKMETAGPFSVLTVQSLARGPDGGDVFQNGAESDYAVTFTARIPVEREDIFFLEIPATITTQKGKNLVCDVTDDENIIPDSAQCLREIGRCTSQGRALLIEVAEIDEACRGDRTDMRYSFVIRKVQNAPSFTTSVQVGAKIRDKGYNDAAEYVGSCTITNNVAGDLDTALGGDTRLLQVSDLFVAENIYTLNFRPANPLPRMGVVKLVYPRTVGLPEGDGSLSPKDSFEDTCTGVTTTSFFGEREFGDETLRYCFLEPTDFDADGQPVDRDDSQRTIWLINLFQESEEYTSEVSLEMVFKNPLVNFEEAHDDPNLQLQQNYRDSFWLSTYTFDMKGDFGVDEAGDYSSSALYTAALNQKLYPVLAKLQKGEAPPANDYGITAETTLQDLVKPIDVYLPPYTWSMGQFNYVKPALRCSAPCFNCFDHDYCTTCWGKVKYGGESGEDFENDKLFLQQVEDPQRGDVQTCLTTCVDGSSVNGEQVDPGSEGDPTKSYFKCVSCDDTCETCKGDGRDQPLSEDFIGWVGDKSLCLTCPDAFPYMLHDTDRAGELPGAQYPGKGYEAWSSCQENCELDQFAYIESNQYSECKKCLAPCAQCKDFEDPGDWCTACDQTEFTPYHPDDVASVQDYVEHSSSMATGERVSFSERSPERKALNESDYNAGPMNAFMNATFTMLPTDELLGLEADANVPTDMVTRRSFYDYYTEQFDAFSKPHQALQGNKCQPECNPGYANEGGVCQPCTKPCETCRNLVTRCTDCDQSGRPTYLYLYDCLEFCPEKTVPDEDRMVCVGCNNDCLLCEVQNPDTCLKCDTPWLLHEGQCTVACPEGTHEPDRAGEKCILKVTLGYIPCPFMVMVMLALVISVGGTFSSKNVFGLHRRLLSFYALMGLIDVAAIMLQLALTFIVPGLPQGMAVMPGLALLATWYLNWCYARLWSKIDPPKPADEEEQTRAEIELINKCDINFDRWNTKYEGMANVVRNVVVYGSHKFFFFPFTHFFGYLHATVRIQDHYVVWQWDEKEVKKYQNRNDRKVTHTKVQEPDYQFRGRLVPRKKPEGREGDFMKEMAQDKADFNEYGDEEMEGGEDPIIAAELQNAGRGRRGSERRGSERRDSVASAQGDKLRGQAGPQGPKFSPWDFMQHPNSYPKRQADRVPDLRILDTFKIQVVVDCVVVRLPMLLGNAYFLAGHLAKEPYTQMTIMVMENMAIAVIQVLLQVEVFRNWENYKLPFKMKDTKANYLFKQKKLANEEVPDDGVGDDLMPEWNKYMHFYKFREIFLDNKLEELLNIFGKRQCKSCIEFPTGTVLEEDPRKVRSYPLSPRGEALYQGMAGDFDLIDFQLQDNVYHEAQEPTVMFESVARDFSDFGAQVLAFDVLNALNRKGGDLVTPGIDDDYHRRKQAKKKRGRKNKYYRQIDQEDDEEANQISDDSDNDGLDNVKEEDDEDDEDEIRKRKEEEEARLRALEAQRRREEDDRRRKEEEERRILQEEEARRRAEEERIRLENDRRERELREEEERLSRDLADKQRAEAQAAERQRQQALALEEQRKKEELDLTKDIVENHSPDGRLQAEREAREARELREALEAGTDGQSTFSGMQVQDDALKNLKEQQDQDIVEAPARPESRRFNECDIIGDLARDEKGNVIPNDRDPDSGKFRDRAGNETNQRGYLVDPKSGAVVNNLNGEKMFDPVVLDERGEVPAPFNVEKHNFNPHQVRGDFAYDRNGKPVINQDKQGAFRDRKGSRVTQRGYRSDDSGNMIDNHDRQKFHSAQMTADGDLPKLFNYNGRRFDVADVIGQCDKDAKGEIIPHQDARGRLVDNLGRPINSRGYLVDEFGNVIDKDGRQIFEKKHLLDGEIPKIFPFTKFNIKAILGDFEMDPLGNPILDKDAHGNLIDNQGKRVNSKGYLIDKDGNVINKDGRIMFKKELLDNEEDIPKVFRTGLLKSDTASSLSRLMSEIERNQPSEFDREERGIQDEIDKQMRGERGPRGNSGNTSVDSMMEDTPANYNVQNQRFHADMEGDADDHGGSGDGMGDDDEDEYGSQYDDMGLTGGLGGFGTGGGAGGAGGELARKKRRKKKKKKKKKPQEMEDPSLREHLLAGAYGGVAKQKPKRQGVKYTTNVDAGLRDIATPASGFIRDPSRTGLQGVTGGESSRGGRKKYGQRGRSSLGGRSDAGSAVGSKVGGRGLNESMSKGLDPQQREARLKQKQMDEIRRKQIAKAKKMQAAGKIGKISKDADFEKMFGKDIDEFLEDSEWDIESIDKMSHFSRGSKNSIRSASQASKLRGLEKVYLQRIEGGLEGKATMGAPQAQAKPPASKGGKKGKFRDDESQGSRAPRAKKAWDAQSRGSAKQSAGGKFNQRK